jgi:hypothetical protein
VNDENWTWRLPFPVEALEAMPDTIERAATLRRLMGEAGRIA